MADSNVFCLLAWVALRLELQEAIIVQENVEEFPLSFLTSFFGGTYFLEAEIRTACTGHGSAIPFVFSWHFHAVT